jgi:hypothetical protein
MVDDEVIPQNKKWLYRVGGGLLLGMLIGAVLGLAVFDNAAIGGGVGMLLGIVIGSAIHVFTKP